MDYVKEHATAGLSFSKQSKFIRNQHHRHSHRRRRAYLKAVKKWNKRQSSEDQLYAEEWGEFRDPDGYNGYVPSSEYFTSLYVQDMVLNSESVRLRMQMIDGQVTRYRLQYKIYLKNSSPQCTHQNFNMHIFYGYLWAHPSRFGNRSLLGMLQ